MGHWQGFTAIYADEGICGISPATRSNVSDRQLYVYSRWASCHDNRPMFYMGLRSNLDVEVGDHGLHGTCNMGLHAISEVGTKRSRLCNCE
eukprot:362242-Pleurochrysis_carterae.AAC.1